MSLQRHAWPYRNRILSAFFVLSLKRNNTTNENNNSNNDFEKKKKSGRREGTRGAWTNEPRPSLDPKYVYVREWRDQCALARNCKLEPNAGIFDFCGHAKKTFDAIHPNRSTELCSSIDIPLCYCRVIDEKTKRSRIRGATHAATLLRTRIVPIEIALVHTAVCTTSMFIYLLFTLFLSLLFLPLS